MANGSSPAGGLGVTGFKMFALNYEGFSKFTSVALVL